MHTQGVTVTFVRKAERKQNTPRLCSVLASELAPPERIVEWASLASRNLECVLEHPVRHFSRTPLRGLGKSAIPLDGPAKHALCKLAPVFWRKEALYARLVFRASSQRVSFMSTFWHSVADQGPVLVLLLTEKGSICGGFSGESWYLSSSCSRKGNRSEHLHSPCSGGRNFLFCLSGPGPGVETGVAYTANSVHGDTEFRSYWNYGNDLKFGGSDLSVSCGSEGWRGRSRLEGDGSREGVTRGASLVQDGSSFVVAELEIWGMSARKVEMPRCR